MLVREFWKIPFLRLFIPLATGILFANFIPLSPYFWFVLFLLFVLLGFIYRPVFDPKTMYSRRWIFGLILNCVLLSSGVYLTIKGKQYDKNITECQLVVGRICNQPKIYPNSIKAEIKVQRYQKEDLWVKTNTKILVSFEADSLSSHLEYGDLILLKGNLKEIINAGNPSEFDYKTYLARKHIHFKTYQGSKEWKLLKKNTGNPLFALSYRLRNKLLKIYQDAGIQGEEFGLLAALTLGTKDYLNDELIEAYSDSGAMHVLCVSGLHVGIILLVLTKLLFFMRKNRYLRILNAFVIIISIWFFALLTGLAPSVNRASAMVTLFVLAKLSKRKPSPYNSIAASAFFLLLIEPQTIFDVGFQLSYAAVISLIFFYQRIYAIYEPRNRITEYLWSLTVVSVSAQIGTTAISIFYFHKFPLYALISNLVVIPAAFVIMYLAILLLMTSFLAPVEKIIAFILENFITFLNKIIRIIESFPFASIEPISLNGYETILINLTLILVFIFIITKNKKVFFGILCTLSFSLIMRDYRYGIEKHTKSFTVYNVPKKSAFSVVNKGKLLLYSDSAMYNNKKSINYLCSNIIANDFITDFVLNKLEISTQPEQLKPGDEILKHLVQFDNLKIIYLNGDYSQYSCEHKLNIDYLIVSKNASMDLNIICKLFNFKQLIADATVPRWKQDILKKDCQQLAIPFHNVTESGAFVYKLKD